MKLEWILFEIGVAAISLTLNSSYMEDERNCYT